MIKMSESRKGYLKILAIILIIFMVLFFRSRVCERVVINGSSMEPNFQDSDICWSDKNYKSLERYDVVVAKVNNELIIKRVIGLPGDMIHLKDGMVYINDEKIASEYDFETYPDGTKQYKRWESDMEDGFYFYTTMDGETVSDEATYICGENQYFLMGDNRQHSADCRLIGPIDEEDITGKIVARFYPFNKITIY